jgi:16S rRNA (guanine527-N7)-methyltransferase
LKVQTITEKNGRMSIEDRQQTIDVWTTLSSNNIVLTKDQIDTLTRFHNDMLYWNEKVNMVSRPDMAHFWERHIIHSLMLLKYVDFKQKARVLDIGTGGGLPGLPVKIARPDLKMTLVDSIAKKMKMTSMFAEHTGLKDIVCLTARVEELIAKPNYQRHFDVIISRAVARIGVLVEWSRPLLAPNGSYAFLKGGDLTEEIAEARTQHPGLVVTETPISCFGIPSFTTDEKKIITCRFS